MASHVRLVVKDHGFKALFARAKEIRNAYAKVGVLADDGEGGGLHEAGGQLTVAEIAVVNEFGTGDGTIPARSFVGATFEAKRDELVELGKVMIDGVLTGKLPMKQALDIMGAKLAAEIKKTITVGAGVPPPNAPATVRAKMHLKNAAKTLGQAFKQIGNAASVRTLVDTGRLLNSITWTAIIGGKETEK